ncbi:M20/M25/M40 family metallo-hydrolase [Methylophaga sp. SB9B]
MRSLWQELNGADSLDFVTATPIMASEDFSYYLQHIPGAFALIGSDDGPDHQVPCHSPYYDFNDRLIPAVTRLFSRLVGVGVPVPEELP